MPALRAVLLFGCPLISLEVDAPNLLNIALPSSTSMLNRVALSCAAGAPASLLSYRLHEQFSEADDVDIRQLQLQYTGVQAVDDDLPALRSLELSGTLPNMLNLTAVEHLRTIKLSSSTLEHLVIPVFVGDRLLDQILQQCGEGLQSLTVPDGCAQITRIALHSSTLRKISVSANTALGEVRLDCPNLEVLSIRNCSGLHAITVNSNKLLSVDLHCTGVTSLKNVLRPGLPLKSLSLDYTPISGVELTAAVQSLPDLVSLSALECPHITGFALAHPHLRFLSFNMCSQLEKLELDCPKLFFLDIAGTLVRFAHVTQILQRATQLRRFIAYEWEAVDAEEDFSAVAAAAQAPATLTQDQLDLEGDQYSPLPSPLCLCPSPLLMFFCMSFPLIY